MNSYLFKKLFELPFPCLLHKKIIFTKDDVKKLRWSSHPHCLLNKECHGQWSRFKSKFPKVRVSLNPFTPTFVRINLKRRKMSKYMANCLEIFNVKVHNHEHSHVTLNSVKCTNVHRWLQSYMKMNVIPVNGVFLRVYKKLSSAFACNFSHDTYTSYFWLSDRMLPNDRPFFNKLSDVNRPSLYNTSNIYIYLF